MVVVPSAFSFAATSADKVSRLQALHPVHVPFASLPTFTRRAFRKDLAMPGGKSVLAQATGWTRLLLARPLAIQGNFVGGTPSRVAMHRDPRECETLKTRKSPIQFSVMHNNDTNAATSTTCLLRIWLQLVVVLASGGRKATCSFGGLASCCDTVSYWFRGVRVVGIDCCAY